MVSIEVKKKGTLSLNQVMICRLQSNYLFVFFEMRWDVWSVIKQQCIYH